MENSLHAPLTTLYLGAAILTEHIIYDKRHSFVPPKNRRSDQSFPDLYSSQHDVSLELATPLPRTLLVTDICNKT